MRTRRWPLALRAVHAAIRRGCGNPKVVSRGDRTSFSLSGLLVRIAACERNSSGLSGFGCLCGSLHAVQAAIRGGCGNSRWVQGLWRLERGVSKGLQI
eukprot:3302664-Prymnesium_polylepis.1